MKFHAIAGFLFLCGMYSHLCKGAGVPVYVMLPLTAVNRDGTLNNPAQLQSDLQKLKNTGVEGVMSDTWWGIVEQVPGRYNFTGYQHMLEIVQAAGLKYQAVMSFHRCGGNVGDACDIPLPSWVVNAAAANDAFYKDQQGNSDQEYISLWADNVPIFQGRTAIQLYSDFMTAYARAMDLYLRNGVITTIEVSMGPSGELRYPSYPSSRWTFCGVGEFQCYDSFALKNLSAAATFAGHSDWGYAGPSNAGSYNSYPSQTGFFSSTGYNNFQSAYGEFFLTWYSQSLINHGDRVLTAARQAFRAYTTKIAGKVAGIHWWYKDISHAAELTAGYFNTDFHNAYSEIAAMFAKHSAEFDFTCLEMEDNQQPAQCECGPFELVQQTKAAAHANGIAYSGENALARYDQTAYSTIEQQSAALGYLINEFTYLRLDSTLLQANNLNTFEQFVRTMANLQPR